MASLCHQKGRKVYNSVKGLHIYVAKKEMQVINIVISDSIIKSGKQKRTQVGSGGSFSILRDYIAQQSLKEWIWVGQILAHSRKE